MAHNFCLTPVVLLLPVFLKINTTFLINQLASCLCGGGGKTEGLFLYTNHTQKTAVMMTDGKRPQASPFRKSKKQLI